MIPLEIEAIVPGEIILDRPIAFDGLLAAVVATGKDLPPASLGVQKIEIPLLCHPRGFHHASQAHLTACDYNLRHWARKLPSISDVSILTVEKRLHESGRFKASWVPVRTLLVAASKLTWWVVGDLDEVAFLLQHVFSLGHRRNSGYGWVANWTINEVEDDQSLTMMVETGRVPTRNLPIDLAPSGWPHLAVANLTYPYWRAKNAGLCAVPPPIQETCVWY